MKKLIGIIFFTLLIVMAVTFFWVSEHRYQQSAVTVNGYRLTVDEALTPAQKELGLGGRKNLAENQGMLFIYTQEQSLPFWMHGMIIPIDIIWLDKNCRVVYLEKNLPPCLAQGDCPIYAPPMDSQYVLETTAGFSDRHQIIAGKTIILSSACAP